MIFDLKQTSALDTNRPGPALVSLRRFRGDLGVVPSTTWRWIQNGWLDKPSNFGGRQYLTQAMITCFMERAARGEFAGGSKPPLRAVATDGKEGGGV